MSYDPTKYVRCDQPRGRGQREMDDMLPFMASFVVSHCPLDADSFKNEFCDALSQKLYHHSFSACNDSEVKTVNNWRTEIAGQLLGLYCVLEDETVIPSPACQTVTENNDQPAFFKNLCLNFQFPNGMRKVQCLKPIINLGIAIRPMHFVLTLLKLAKSHSLSLTKSDIQYYVLSVPDVLTGNSTPEEVLDAIKTDRASGLSPSVKQKAPADANDAWIKQHIDEQLNLLALANLIHFGSGLEAKIFLNEKETQTLQMFYDELAAPLSFDISAYNLNTPEGYKKMQIAWRIYYGSMHCQATILQTSANALVHEAPSTTSGMGASTPPAAPTSAQTASSTVVIGEEGEELVFDLEKKRVSQSHPRLVNKVIRLGYQKGLGYDVLSVEAAEDAQNPEFARMIEVKTTKRSTPPDVTKPGWNDSFSVTRKEWVAAKQYGKAFSIYRVYLTPQGNFIYRITDPAAQAGHGTLCVECSVYDVTMFKNSITKEYSHA